MLTGLLPIGTVVLLKDSTKRVMIIGVCQKEISEEEKIWDYAGCLYPEGVMGPDRTFLFNTDQIQKLYFIGFQDEEQFGFKIKADEALIALRKQDQQQDQEQEKVQ